MDKEKMLLLQQSMVYETGGNAGARDANLLDVMLNEVFQQRGEKHVYLSTLQKACQLGYYIMSNRLFMSGNKRTGMYVFITFLEMNGVSVIASKDEIVNMAIGISTGKCKYKDFLKWAKRNTE
ncbi:MAG: type II toxin-antitoxin system death-on-curing family toxin [Christensenellaceae bacterium]|nr:type II toxin-antitoxin system death-on-curing family toxin [Christensenellaceae bacterium]